MVVAVVLPLRLWSYSIYLRLHQGMAVTIVGSLWIHLHARTKFPRIYLWSLSGTFGATTIILLATAYYHHCFDRRSPWFDRGISGDTKVVRIPRRVQQVSAGQYVTVHRLRFWPWQISNAYRLAFYQAEGSEIQSSQMKRWRRISRPEVDSQISSSVVEAEMELWVERRPDWQDELNRPSRPPSRWLIRGPYGPAIAPPTVPHVVLVGSGNRIAPLLWLSHTVVRCHRESRTQVQSLHIHWFIDDWSKMHDISSHHGEILHCSVSR